MPLLAHEVVVAAEKHGFKIAANDKTSINKAIATYPFCTAYQVAEFMSLEAKKAEPEDADLAIAASLENAQYDFNVDSKAEDDEIARAIAASLEHVHDDFTVDGKAEDGKAEDGKAEDDELARAIAASLEHVHDDFTVDDKAEDDKAEDDKAEDDELACAFAASLEQTSEQTSDVDWMLKKFEQTVAVDGWLQAADDAHARLQTPAAKNVLKAAKSNRDAKAHAAKLNALEPSSEEAPTAAELKRKYYAGDFMTQLEQSYLFTYWKIERNRHVDQATALQEHIRLEIGGALPDIGAPLALLQFLLDAGFTPTHIVGLADIGHNHTHHKQRMSLLELCVAEKIVAAGIF